MKSKLIKGNIVEFPDFRGENIYMIPFKIVDGLPDSLSRWNKTIGTMLNGIETDDIICLTIHQSAVKKGKKQRREGRHIDCGYKLITRGHIPVPPTHGISSIGGGVILASSHIGCKAWEGDIKGQAKLFGDCDHLDVRGTTETTLQSNTCYLGNGTMLHEAISAAENQNRTFVRLSMPKSFAA